MKGGVSCEKGVLLPGRLASGNWITPPFKTDWRDFGIYCEKGALRRPTRAYRLMCTWGMSEYSCISPM